MDQTNSFKNQIEQTKVLFGASVSTFSPTLVELLGELGIDFVWVDYEHHGPSPWNSQQLENLARAAELTGTELLVRIPEANPSLIRKVLDTGVRNILIPRVDTASDVRACVKAGRYSYEGSPGERGNATARTNTWRSADDYLATEDKEICIGVMIEKSAAIDNLNEILKVPELGFIFIGPSDLSVQLGMSKGNPDISRTIDDVKCRSIEAGVPVGCIKSDPDDAQTAIDDGYQIVRITSDFGAVKTVVRDRLEKLR